MKKKATLKKETQLILSSLHFNGTGIYFGDEAFKTDAGVVNLHPFQGTQSVLYMHECFFDSNGIKPPIKPSDFFGKRNGHSLFSEYKVQGLVKGNLFVQVIV